MRTTRIFLLTLVLFFAPVSIDCQGQDRDLTRALVMGLARGDVSHKQLASNEARVLNQRVLLSFHEISRSKLQGKREWTPLTASIACGDYVATTVLVSAGADVNRKEVTPATVRSGCLWRQVARNAKFFCF